MVHTKESNRKDRDELREQIKGEVVKGGPGVAFVTLKTRVAAQKALAKCYALSKTPSPPRFNPLAPNHW